MATYEITAELNLKKIISESREVAKAFNEFADELERIEKKYEESHESEDEDERRCEICKHCDCLGKKCMNHNIHVDLTDICDDFADKREASICDDCLYKDNDHNTCVIADNWGISCNEVTTCPDYKRGVKK